MSVLVNKNTKVICQGFTGSQGTFHSEQAIAYGTKMVGGVTPGKGGTDASRPAGVRHGRGSRAENRRQRLRHLCAAALRGGCDSGSASTAEIPLVVCITEGIPVLDMVQGQARACKAPKRA